MMSTSSQAVMELLTQAQTTGTPLLTDTTATFLWQGDRPPQLIGDFNAWDPRRAPAWEQVAAGIWTCQIELLPDAYIEYGFTEGDDPDGRIPDPLNPRTTPNGVGQINHYFYMPAGGPTPLARRVRGTPAGVVTHHLVRAPRVLANGKRDVWLYRPPAPGPWPLVVVFDGRDYLRRAKLPTIVDNLIAQGRMRPVALALADNGGPARVVEYGCSDATLGFVLDFLMPLATAELDLVDWRATPGAWGVMGASMGGLISLYVGLRASEVFGHVLSQSGAFGDEYRPVVVDLVRDGAVRPLKIWMDCGRYEWLLPGNRRMHELLVGRGYRVAYREFSAGHNYPAWRDDVGHGLEWLFGTGR